MPTLQEMATRDAAFSGGHRMCAGCPVPVFTKMLTRVTDHEIVAGSATGCLEVASSIFPYSAWKVPWVHTAFENVAATMSGVETMYQVLRRKGKTEKGRHRSQSGPTCTQADHLSAADVSFGAHAGSSLPLVGVAGPGMVFAGCFPPHWPGVGRGYGCRRGDGKERSAATRGSFGYSWPRARGPDGSDLAGFQDSVASSGPRWRKTAIRP